MRTTTCRALARIAAVVLGATSCLSGPAIAPKTFSIDPPAPRSAVSTGTVILAVPRVEVTQPYSGQSLIYSTGEHTLQRDPYARFVAPPGALLTAAIRGYLVNADFVRDVVAPGDGELWAATVDVAVSKMEGELRPGGSSAVLIMRIRVRSGPAMTREPGEILLKTYTSTIPITRTTAQDFVNAWNQGLENIMTQFQSDLRSSLVAAGSLQERPGAPPGRS
jgi:ABC-type transport auxiliary lipoprotein component